VEGVVPAHHPHQDSHPVQLLSLRAVAGALGISYWTARELVVSGALPAVRLPSVRSKRGANRKLLVDARDLERLIERSKEAQA
jgi:predicted site-specific integrase-resolvase